jgi:low affinity Fe/Cu permease
MLHAAAIGPVEGSVAVAHVSLAAWWAGSLYFLRRACLHSQIDRLGTVVARFSAMALSLTGVLVIAGLALVMILAWAALGPTYGWSEGHQLFINTITTIVTFLIVFLIQNTQNRDTKALHLKIDELLKATGGARNSMIDLDRLSDEQLRRLEAEFKRICADDSDKTA